jgi:DNA repair protein RadD
VKPWPHQERAHNAVAEAFRAGHRRICLVAMTGAGKTFMGSRIAAGAAGKGNSVLWIAHREELIDQAAKALQRVGCDPGIIAPWAPTEAKPLQVASVQTLLSRGTMPDASVVVFDECHHAVSDEWIKVPKHYEAKGAFVLGLTATPQRGDGRGLGEVFQSMVVACQPAELIASGHLVKPKVLRPASNNKALAEHPLQAYLQHANGRQAIVFCSSVEAAAKLAGEFEAAGITAANVDGTQDRAKRRGAIEMFRLGRIRVLTNMHVLTEGFDAPETSCVILARGFSTMGSYIQAVGRGLRAAPNKTDCIVLDLMGASLDHGLPDDAREYTLDGKAISLAETSGEVLTTCKRCGTVYRGPEFDACECPGCGYRSPARQDPRIRRRELQEAAQREGLDGRADFLSRAVLRAIGAGHKVGKAAVAFKVRYNQWPSAVEKKISGYTACEEALHEAFIHAATKNSGKRVQVEARGHVPAKAVAMGIREAIRTSPRPFKLETENGVAIVRFE